MINLIELNKQKRYIETKQALETFKAEIAEAINDSIKTIEGVNK